MQSIFKLANRCAVLFVLGACLPRSLGIRPSTPARDTHAAFRTIVDSLANDLLRTGPVAGVSIGVLHANDTLVWRGFGFADLETHAPATSSTVYWAASAIKPLTAAAVIRAADAGRLSLDDTVGRWLPHAPMAMRPVMIRQLLNHTSGIRNMTSAPAWRDNAAQPLSADSLIGLVARDTLDFAPGSSWRYSNTNFVLLGMILERATGESYAAHVTRTMLQRYGMRSSSLCDGPPDGASAAAGYERKQGALARVAPVRGHLFSAGALCTTIGDLTRWARALAGGDVLSSTRLREMTAPIGAARTAPVHYGYGIANDSLAGHHQIHHPGGAPGYAAHFAVFPEDSLTVVVLMNTGPGIAEPFAGKIAEAWFRELRREP